MQGNYKNDEPKIEEEFKKIEQEGADEIEVATFTLLHPSLDFKNDVAVFGFRALMKDNKENNIFLVVKDGELEITRLTDFKHNGTEYRIDYRKRLLNLLAERWSFKELQNFIKNPQLPENILPTIEATLKKYTQLPDESDYLLLAAWIIGTYLFPIFWAYPFFNPKAPKDSGKTQLQNLLLKLCFNAVKARPTLAALVDTVDALRGTYIIDQADSLHNPIKEEILEILTDSYVYEGGKRRIIEFGKQKNERKVVESETYCPKIFGSHKELPEDLRDRVIFIPMAKSRKNFPAPTDYNENWRLLRGNIYKFVALKFKEVWQTYHQLIESYRNDPKIIGRCADLWIPLETIMNLCAVEKQRIEGAKALFLQRYGFTQYSPSEQEESIVLAINQMFGEQKTITASPKEIAKILPTEGMDETEKKKLPQKVGWAIKKFNLSAEVPKRSSKGTVYTFHKESVDGVISNYFSNTPQEPAPAYTDAELQMIGSTLGVATDSN